MGILIFIGWVCVIYLLMTCAMTGMTIAERYFHREYLSTAANILGLLVIITITCVLVVGLAVVML